MDQRHHHTCHLSRHHHPPPPPPPFDRFGAFPSRILPPISSSSSSTSSDSNLRFKFRCPLERRSCACICVAVLSVCIGAVAGICLGYQFLNLSPAIEQLFRGSFRVINGDTYKRDLSEADSVYFKSTAQKYKKSIDAIYQESVLKNAFRASEILAFDGIEGGALIVQFNVHMDTYRIRVDAGDLFITLAEAIRSAKGLLPSSNITIDQDSIEIQERNMEFLYLPSTERNLNGHILLDDQFIIPSESSSTSQPAYPLTTLPPSIPTCQPMNVKFCVDYNTTFSTQKEVSKSLAFQMSLIVESRCHPFSAHFLCAWGVACAGGLLPCRDYCEEFLSNCGRILPPEIKSELRCDGPKWLGEGTCLTKPGCVEELYKTGQAHRVCDGVMDCFNFEDEIHCPYCKPGHFHCGAGRNCISADKKCDGKKDCPNESDEKACLTLAPSAEAAGYVHQYFNEGYLFVHDQGKLGKLCVERNESSQSRWTQDSPRLLDNIGASACELLGFRKVAFVRVETDAEANLLPPISNSGPSYVRIHDPGSSSEVTFKAGICASRKVLYVGCNHLECGERPSHSRSRTTGLVGHGDFPWHAILLKNGEHVCDATLITSQWLLTTLSCFGEKETKAKWSVHFGRIRLQSTSPWQQERRIIGMVKSPMGDNLVLIKMASPVIFSDFARHICLPEEPDGTNRYIFPTWSQKSTNHCLRLGWNKQDEVIETRMQEVGPERCLLGHSGWLNMSSTLCLENSFGGKDCLGEVKVYPGAPYFCQSDEIGEWVLSGIAPAFSRPKCGIEKYKVTKVRGTTHWILKTIEALSLPAN